MQTRGEVAGEQLLDSGQLHGEGEVHDLDGVALGRGEVHTAAAGDEQGAVADPIEVRCDGRRRGLGKIDLARHAQKVGADYIVVHAPLLHFFKAQDETLYQYYRTIAEQVDIGIALWSHPDSGYLMSPQLCNRLADIENVVAIKYSVPRAMYAELTRLAGDRILVSTASEEEWLDNIVELGWQVYLCSSPPYLIQTAADRRMRDYTDLAFAGEVEKAHAIRDSLNPVREALRTTRPAEKPHAHQKYWQELLGQVGGRVRAPLLELTEAEKAATRAAFESCGLQLAGAPLAKAG